MDRRHQLILAALVMLAGLVYLPSLGAPLAFEDAHQFAPPVWAIPGRALTAWTWAWPALRHPFAAHALNLTLHLVNGVLVALLLTMLVDETLAVIAAGIFLLHPLSSEAVLYATGRAEVLLTLFTLLAVWWAVQWVDRAGWWRGLLCGFALCGAALSKEIGLVAVPIVVLTLFVLRPHRPTAAFVINALWMMSGLVLGCTWWRISTWLVTVDGQTVFSWPTFASLQLAQVWHLFAMTVTLSGFTIDHDALATSVAWQRVAMLFTLAMVAIAVWAWSRRPWLAWALGWIAICVAPRFVFASYEFTKEYQIYPAMVAVSCLTGWLLLQVPSLSHDSFREG